MTAPDPQRPAVPCEREAHTQGPWTLDMNDGERLLILDADNDIIAQIDTRGFWEPEDGIAAGRLIVRAVNSHDPLVTALKVCLEAIDAAHADPEAGLPSRAWHWWAEARAALAAAGEPSHG